MLSCIQGYEYQVLICVHVNTKTGIRPITEILKVHVNAGLFCLGSANLLDI